MNHPSHWLFYRAWWMASADTMISRATARDIETGAWTFDHDRRTPASLDEVALWVADRPGQVFRSFDSLEWWPESPAVDFETQMRWWPALNIASGWSGP